MPREKDPFRDYVEFLQNDKGKWTCNFCNIENRGSVTRIKAHLAGVGGYGIIACKKVDHQVKLEARKALKSKGEAESSNGSEGNVEEGAHQARNANNEDAPRENSVPTMPCLGFDGVSSSAFLPFPDTNLPDQFLHAQVTIPQMDYSFRTLPPQHHAGDYYIQPPNMSDPSISGDLTLEVLANMRGPVNVEEGDPNTEIPQDDALVNSRPNTCGLVHENMPNLKRKLEELSNREADMDELEAWCRKAERIKGEYWSMVRAFREGRSLALLQVERVDDFSKEVEDILGHCSFRKGSTTHAAGCRKSLPLVTTELVGEESEVTIKRICDYLMEDEIVIIGIYGMGGVGKTAISMHVHNRILENPAFNDVFWVTVPREFSLYELQEEIAHVVGLDNLSKDKDVKRRACVLNRHLKEKKKRSVLLLDELWMHFEVEDVGIPIEKGGLKLVLTTRSLDVCHKMLCQEQIKIGSLQCKDDRLSLFLKKLSFGRELPSEVKKIAMSILDKCGGLPLGIIEIATRMRGVEEVHEWKGMLRKLKDSRVELDVFKRLKLSYVNLGDSQVQQCFLHLILCFGKYFSEDEDVKEYFSEDVIESFIDEGLLSEIATRQELRDQGKTILDNLTKACPWDDPEEVYQKVHPLIRDMALQIATSATHMVQAGMGLKEIPEEEFWTDSLEKVFLQRNSIEEIPQGISPNCPKLTRLSLNDNVSLKAIHESFFRYLNGLKVLDLSNTRIKKLPDPVTQLESLEALLLRGCEKLRRIPCVGKLGSLRKLDLNGCAMIEEVPEGMKRLVKLTYLDLHGTKIGTFPKGLLGKLVDLQYLGIGKAWAISKARPGEKKRILKLEYLECSVSNVETLNSFVRFIERNSYGKYKLDLNASEEDFPTVYYERYRWDNDWKKIIIGSCHNIAAWEDGGIAGDGCALLPKNVKVLRVGGCGGVTSLCEVGALEDLEELAINEWENLEGVGAVHFPRLERLYISGCPKLKHLWEEGQQQFPRLTTLLPNLEDIVIGSCEKLEEIIGGGPLPSGVTWGLKYLEVSGCNNMKRVLLTQDMLLHLPSLQTVIVRDCEGIEVIIGTVANTAPGFFPKLTNLTLWDLPELKSICEDGGTVSCDSLERLDIWKCQKLKRIPVRPCLLDDGLLPSPPHSLQWIWIDNRQTWESLEWDDPRAPSSLQQLVWFYMEDIESDRERDRESEEG